MIDENIKAVESKKHSKNGKIRYVIKNIKTGKILDDAQGYGYKTAQKAYAAYAYKTRDKSLDKEKALKREKIKRWMKEHKDFVNDLECFAIEITKGSWGPDDKVDAKLVRSMLKQRKLDVDFTPGELLKTWMNG